MYTVAMYRVCNIDVQGLLAKQIEIGCAFLNIVLRIGVYILHARSPGALRITDIIDTQRFDTVIYRK